MVERRSRAVDEVADAVDGEYGARSRRADADLLGRVDGERDVVAVGAELEGALGAQRDGVSELAGEERGAAGTGVGEAEVAADRGA